MVFRIHMEHGVWDGKTDLYFDTIDKLKQQINDMLGCGAFDFTVRAK